MGHLGRPVAVEALAGILVLVALAWFGIIYARWITTNFVVTTDRLIYRHGVLSKHGIEIPLERVNTVFFSQSILERIVGSGDLVIESAGEMGRQNFSNVRKPSAVQNEIYRQMESNENRKFDRIGGHAATRRCLRPRADPAARRPPPAGRAHRGRVPGQEGPAPRPHVALLADDDVGTGGGVDAPPPVAVRERCSLLDEGDHAAAEAGTGQPRAATTPGIVASSATSPSSAGVDTSKSSRRLAWLAAITARMAARSPVASAATSASTRSFSVTT